MNQSPILFAIALAFLRGGAHAIDLTPRFIDKFTAGIATRRMYFADGEQRISIYLNPETTVEPAAGGAAFRIRGFPDFLFILRRSPIAAEQPFSGVSFERYREAARRLLPPRATGVKVLAEEAETLTINGWHSFRFLYSFDTATSYCKSSVTFLNLNSSDQLALVTTSDEKNFEDAIAREWQIIRTWQSL